MKFTDITPTQAQRYLNIAAMEYGQHITKADKTFFDDVTDAAIKHFRPHLEKYIVRDKNGNITHLQMSLAKLYKSVYLSEGSEVNSGFLDMLFVLFCGDVARLSLMGIVQGDYTYRDGAAAIDCAISTFYEEERVPKGLYMITT